MKAQTPTAEVRKILFVENSIVEKRREWRHSGECRGTRKPVIPWVRVRIGFYSFFFLHCLMVEIPFRCKWVFPMEEKCLLDHLSPFGTSCSPSFSPSFPPLSGRPNCF
jgi:hypothetical protein